MRSLWPRTRLLWYKHPLPLLALLPGRHHGSLNGHGLLWALVGNDAWLLVLSCRHGTCGCGPLPQGRLHDLRATGPLHHLHGLGQRSSHALLRLLGVHGQTIHVDPVVLVLLGLCHQLYVVGHLDRGKWSLLGPLLRRLGGLGERGLLLM